MNQSTFASRLAQVPNLANDTRDAFMADEYGPDRWTSNIRSLALAGYSAEAIEWIVRSKIARWAFNENMPMVDYIARYVGDARLTDWMNDPYQINPIAR